jgi:hypothetical protein
MSDHFDDGYHDGMDGDDSHQQFSSSAPHKSDEQLNARVLKLDMASLPKAAMHSLPCTISHEGVANIDRFFHVTGGINPEAAVGGSSGSSASSSSASSSSSSPAGAAAQPQSLHAQFRGREMIGRHVPLPAETVGVVIASNTHTGALTAVKAFDALTVWHRAPVERESLQRVVRSWLPIAHAVHFHRTVLMIQFALSHISSFKRLVNRPPFSFFYVSVSVNVFVSLFCFKLPQLHDPIPLPSE